eukprot:1150131-Pelagomonas_calceolata.AAC.3
MDTLDPELPQTGLLSIQLRTLFCQTSHFHEGSTVQVLHCTPHGSGHFPGGALLKGGGGGGGGGEVHWFKEEVERRCAP